MDKPWVSQVGLRGVNPEGRDLERWLQWAGRGPARRTPLPGARPALLQRAWCCCCNHVFPSQTSDNCLQGCIFRGNLAGCESSLPAGQLVALPLIPSARPPQSCVKQKQDTARRLGRNHAVTEEQGDLPRSPLDLAISGPVVLSLLCCPRPEDGEHPESLQYMPVLAGRRRTRRPRTPTHSQHALLQVPRHLPADALLNVSACHSLILVEN